MHKLSVTNANVNAASNNNSHIGFFKNLFKLPNSFYIETQYRESHIHVCYLHNKCQVFTVVEISIP